MSKIFNYYNNNIDRTWYDSSNIVYSECIDNQNDLKTLIIVFKNGTQYQYDNVDVNDYLLFRESSSQGKELNNRIKGKNYKFKKLDNANLELLNEELMFRSQNGINIELYDERIVLRNKFDVVTYEYSLKENDDKDNISNIMKNTLFSVGVPCEIIDKQSKKYE